MEHKPRKVARPTAEKSRRFKVRPTYVILGVLMALFAFKFIQKTQEIRQLQQQEAALRYENQQTAQQNAQLQREIITYRSAQWVADQARSLLGFTMPGEVPIQPQIVHQPVVEARPAPVPTPAPSVPVWKQWWRVFFG
jgi:cell division protein FtsB